MRFLISFFLICFTFMCFGQNIIEGEVRSSTDSEGISFALIVVEDETSKKAFSSDENGAFKFNLEDGIYRIFCSSIGFSSSEIYLEVPTDKKVIIVLNEIPIESQEAVIKAKALRNPNATLLTKSFFQRIPGAFNDPSRLTIKFPGISPTNDQNNQVVVRGLAPHLSRWAINGTSILNPNHLSNAGTITDQASSSGGGVNMISGNSIDQYVFYNNPVSHHYNSVGGGISNTKLGIPKGMQFSLGLLGTELSYGYDKKFKAGINYRYSTLGILSAIGVDLGDEQIQFQDLHAHFSKKLKDHTFSNDFLIGNNRNYHASLGEESVLFKDAQNIDFKGYQIINAFSHQHKKGKIKKGHHVNFSTISNERFAYLDLTFPEYSYYTSFNSFRQYLISINVNREIELFNFFKLESIIQYDYSNYYSSVLQQPEFIENRIYASGALAYKRRGLDSKLSIGLVNSRDIPQSTIHFNIAYGKNLHKIKFQYAKQIIRIIPEINIRQNFAPFSSNSFSLDYYLNKNKLYVQAGIFYNYFSDLPISTENYVSYFDRVDLIMEDLPHGRWSGIGTAEQYGVQAQMEYLVFNKLQFISGFSIYDLKAQREDVSINSSYNFNYTHANTLSYSTALKNNKLIASLSLVGRGAGYEPEINELNSQNLLVTQHELTVDKVRLLKPYFRLDLKVDYIWGNNGANRLSLDAQNVTNQKNDAFYFYDPLTQKTILQNQLGIIPIIKYTRKIF